MSACKGGEHSLKLSWNGVMVAEELEVPNSAAAEPEPHADRRARVEPNSATFRDNLVGECIVGLLGAVVWLDLVDGALEFKGREVAGSYGESEILKHCIGDPLAGFPYS